MGNIERVVCITVAVKDQEEALKWYTEKLGFEKRMDMTPPAQGNGPKMRWLTVSPKQDSELEIVLATWFPGKVGQNLPVILQTTDCERAYAEFKERGVEFSQPPQARPYGTEAVFKDLYGNTYAMRQAKTGR
jgi:uncharacterized glyoxalase superfamily protein PhnB